MTDARTFQAFWQRFFPEQRTTTRAEALEYTGESEYGQMSARPDYEMVVYQNRVADVYGAYETAEFQFATIQHILRTISFPIQNVVSLGCGPASYELWLISQGEIDHAALVDHSPMMLERAKGIARKLGIEDRIECVSCDVLQNPLRPQSADTVFCINAMHWSRRWTRWIFEAARIAKIGGEAFLSCSLAMPRSGITADELLREMRRRFDITDQGPIVLPQLVGGGMAAVSTRTFVVGRRRKI